MSNSSTVLGTDNLAFVELLYSRFLEDPNSVPEDFRRYFESEHPATNGSVRLGPSFAARSLFDPNGSASIHVSVPRAPGAPNGANGVANGVHANGVAARAKGASNGNGAHANGARDNGARDNGAPQSYARAPLATPPGTAPAPLSAPSPAVSASGRAPAADGASEVLVALQDRVDQLVRAYR